MQVHIIKVIIFEFKKNKQYFILGNKQTKLKYNLLKYSLTIDKIKKAFGFYRKLKTIDFKIKISILKRYILFIFLYLNS